MSPPSRQALMIDSSAAKPNLNLEVIVLPTKCDDPDYVKSLNEVPGMLALGMQKRIDPATKQSKLEPLPFIVPGARFNEMYYWDSVSLPCLHRGVPC